MTVVASTAPSTLVAPSRGTGIPIIPDVAMIEDEEEQRASNEIIEGPSSVVEVFYEYADDEDEDGQDEAEQDEDGHDADEVQDEENTGEPVHVPIRRKSLSERTPWNGRHSVASMFDTLDAELDYLESFVSARDVLGGDCGSGRDESSHYYGVQMDSDGGEANCSRTRRGKRARRVSDGDAIAPLSLRQPQQQQLRAQDRLVHPSSSYARDRFNDDDMHCVDPVRRVENTLCKDFNCCGIVLRDMHELLGHYEECHVQFEDCDVDGHRQAQHDLHAASDALLVDDVAKYVSVGTSSSTAASSSLTGASANSSGRIATALPNQPPLEAIMDEFEYHMQPREGRLTIRHAQFNGTPDATVASTDAARKLPHPRITTSIADSAEYRCIPEVPVAVSPAMLGHGTVSAPATPLFGPTPYPPRDKHISAFDDSVIRTSAETARGTSLLLGGDGPASSNDGLIRRVGDIVDDLDLRLLEMMEQEMQLQDAKGSSGLLLADIEMDTMSPGTANGGRLRKKGGSRPSKKARTATPVTLSATSQLSHETDEEIDVVTVEKCSAGSPMAERKPGQQALLPPAASVGEAMMNAMNVPILSLNEALGLEYPAHASLEESADRADKPYRCSHPGCDKAYKNPNGLKYHNLHGHCDGDEQDDDFAARLLKPYVCNFPHCFKRYKNLNGLKYHMEKTHGFSKSDSNQLATTIVKLTNAEYGINARSVSSNVLLAAMKEREEQKRQMHGDDAGQNVAKMATIKLPQPVAVTAHGVRVPTSMSGAIDGAPAGSDSIKASVQSSTVKAVVRESTSTLARPSGGVSSTTVPAPSPGKPVPTSGASKPVPLAPKGGPMAAVRMSTPSTTLPQLKPALPVGAVAGSGPTLAQAVAAQRLSAGQRMSAGTSSGVGVAGTSFNPQALKALLLSQAAAAMARANGGAAATPPQPSPAMANAPPSMPLNADGQINIAALYASMTPVQQASFHSAYIQMLAASGLIDLKRNPQSAALLQRVSAQTSLMRSQSPPGVGAMAPGGAPEQAQQQQQQQSRNAPTTVAPATAPVPASSTAPASSNAHQASSTAPPAPNPQ